VPEKKHEHINHGCLLKIHYPRSLRLRMSPLPVTARTMTLQEFMQSLEKETAPASFPAPLLALWYAHRGAWDDAHHTVQNESDSKSALVHAYLHRQEGDDWNARYWYNRARRSPFRGTLEAEWRALVDEFLEQREESRCG
jgi:hypothetical protein